MKNCKLCNIELKKLDYYYYRDFFNEQLGNLIWGEGNILKRLYYCPECGLVYVIDEVEHDSRTENCLCEELFRREK